MKTPTRRPPSRRPPSRRPPVNVSGRVDRVKRDEIMIVCDASFDHISRRVGLGFVATSGHWGIRGHRHDYTEPGDSDIAELRAIAYAWEWINPGRGRPVALLTDNSNAVDYVTRWRTGDLALPNRYRAAYRATGKQPALVALAEAVHAHLDLTVTWLEGHTGHPLQECADSLARIGYRAQLTPEQARTTGATIARNRLADWRGAAMDDTRGGTP